MTQALTKTDDRSLKALLLKAMPSISGVIPKNVQVDSERIVRIALVACSRDDKLMACSPKSILGAIMQSSQLGLEIGGVSGHAYLVPYKNTKSGKLEAQFIPGYRGLVQLIWRAAKIDMEADVVREGDRFEFQKGTSPHLLHVPTLSDKPAKFLATWALARLLDGRTKFEVMGAGQVDAIKARSPSAHTDYSPWTTDYGEMAKKTVAKRLCKWLPINDPKLAKAIEIDNRADQGITTPLDVIDVPAEEPEPEPEPSAKVEEIKKRGRKAKKGEMSDEEKAAIEQREWEARQAERETE
jgi:recombination protein RecT